MEEHKKTRTVRKRFLIANNMGKTVKGVGGFAASAAAGFSLAMVARNASKSENMSNHDNKNIEYDE